MVDRRILLRIGTTLRRLGERRRQRQRAATMPPSEAWQHMLMRLQTSEAERRLRDAELALNQLR